MKNKAITKTVTTQTTKTVTTVTECDGMTTTKTTTTQTTSTTVINTVPIAIGTVTNDQTTAIPATVTMSGMNNATGWATPTSSPTICASSIQNGSTGISTNVNFSENYPSFNSSTEISEFVRHPQNEKNSIPATLINNRITTQKLSPERFRDAI